MSLLQRIAGEVDLLGEARVGAPPRLKKAIRA